MPNQSAYSGMIQRRFMACLVIYALPIMLTLIGAISLASDLFLLKDGDTPPFLPETPLNISAHQLKDIRLQGNDDIGNTYELIAKQATQWTTNNTNFDLGAFSFSIPLSDGTEARYRSGYGTYFETDQIVKMGSPVKLDLSGQRSFSAESISVSLQHLTLSAKGQVHIDFSPLTVKANQMIIDNKTRSITLNGRVKIHVSPWGRLAHF